MKLKCPRKGSNVERHSNDINLRKKEIFIYTRLGSKNDRLIDMTLNCNYGIVSFLKN